MDPSSVQHMEMASNSLENMLVCSKSQQDSRKPRPQPEEALKCPRCDSTNTKFCYYNNYSLSQPRYFCKSCRRYWTKGGTLRNVPVGGGCRKNKRSSSSSSSKRSQDYQSPLITPNNNPLTYDTSDLNLAFARLRKQASGQLGIDHDNHHDLSILGNPTNNTTHYDILGNPISHGFLDAQNINNFHNGCYDFGNGGGWGVGVGAGGEIMGMMPYEEFISPATTNAVTVTTMKQEMLCNGRELGENRSIWGFPWQINGDGNMGDLESSARESWNFDLLQPGMGFSIAH